MRIPIVPNRFTPTQLIPNPLLKHTTAGDLDGAGVPPLTWTPFFQNQGSLTHAVGAPASFGRDRNYTDLALGGTSGTSSFWSFGLVDGLIVSEVGDLVEFEVHLALVAGAITNISSVYLNIFSYEDGFGDTDSEQGADVKGLLTGGLQKFVLRWEIDHAASQFLIPSIGVTFANSSAVSATLRFGGPSLRRLRPIERI